MEDSMQPASKQLITNLLGREKNLPLKSRDKIDATKINRFVYGVPKTGEGRGSVPCGARGGRAGPPRDRRPEAASAGSPGESKPKGCCVTAGSAQPWALFVDECTSLDDCDDRGWIGCGIGHIG